jgi:transcriptional regulator with XRE-family HTH domain
VNADRAERGNGRLYDAIGQAGFSIDGFARRMRVHRTTVWRIDRGEIAPGLEWLARAADLLGVPVEDLRPAEEMPAA